MCVTSRFDALNSFLNISGINPIKSLQGDLSSASERTQKRYIEKTKQCLEQIVSTICPGDENSLRVAVLGESVEKDDDLTLDSLVEIYRSAETWTLQR